MENKVMGDEGNTSTHIDHVENVEDIELEKENDNKDGDTENGNKDGDKEKDNKDGDKEKDNKDGDKEKDNKDGDKENDNKENGCDQFGDPCLICGEKLGRNDDKSSKTVEEGDEVLSSNQRLKNLCQALRVTLVKSGGWDFEKEAFPLCSKCAEVCDRLGTILEQVKSLETEYSNWATKLKALVSSASSEERDRQIRQDQSKNSKDDRVYNFRKLVLGECPQERKRGRPKKKNASHVPVSTILLSKPSLDSVLTSNLSNVFTITNVLSEDDESDVDKKSCIKNRKRANTTRKSRRNPAESFKKQVFSGDDFSDTGTRSSFMIKEENLLGLVSDDQEDFSQSPPDMSLKLEVQIKQEMESFSESERFFEEIEIHPPQGQGEVKERISGDNEDMVLNPPPKGCLLGKRKATLSRKRVNPRVKKGKTKISPKKRKPLTPPTSSTRTKKKIEVTSPLSDFSDSEDDEDPSTDYGDPDFNLEEERKKSKKGTHKVTNTSNRRESSSSGHTATHNLEINDVSSSESDDSEMDGYVAEGAFRKWKIDKEKGRMWYNGVEVITIPTGLQCNICSHVIHGDKGSKNKSYMKTHINGKHLANFVCPICNKNLTTRNGLDMHIRSVHEKTVNIPCTICDKPFTSSNAMRRHRWSHMNAEEKDAALASGMKRYTNGSDKLELLQCGSCGKMCRGHYRLKQHEEIHLEKKERQKHMCQVCGSIYSAADTLRSHIKINHDDTRLQWLQCPHCPKKYPQSGLLKKHMRVHTGEKPYICEECGAAFSNGNLLKVHLMKHKNDRPHQCTYCSMAFYRLYHLTRHVNAYHLNPNPPKRKLPYRSWNGTRKPPQKRVRRPSSSIVSLSTPVNPPSTSTNLPVKRNAHHPHITGFNNPHHQNQQSSSCDHNEDDDDDTNESDSGPGVSHHSFNTAIPLRTPVTDPRQIILHSESGMNFGFPPGGNPPPPGGSGSYTFSYTFPSNQQNHHHHS